MLYILSHFDKFSFCKKNIITLPCFRTPNSEYFEFEYFKFKNFEFKYFKFENFEFEYLEFEYFEFEYLEFWMLELVLWYKLEIGTMLEGCLSKQKTFVTHLVTE